MALARLRGVRAVTDLGCHRTAVGDVRGADAAFRLAIESGDVFFGLNAALHLWVLHARHGDRQRSRDAFREAVRLAVASEATSVGEACVHIGSMLGADYSFLPGAGAARIAFEDTIGSGDRDLRPKAALGLAMMLWSNGEPFEEVHAAFRVALDSGHPECTATAEKWFATYRDRVGAEDADAKPPPDDTTTEDGLVADLDRNLWLCPACGALYIVNWMVFPEDADGCDECHPTVVGATTEAVALQLTGWSETRLLNEAYVVATEVARMNPTWGAEPFVEEIERRLGMSPPIPGEGPDMDQVKVATVTEALDVLHRRAIPAAPIVDEARVRAEHHLLRRSWGGPVLRSGSPTEITDVLRRNLERDATLPGYRGILVNAIDDQYCAQVVSLIGDQGRAYRVWRTPDRLWSYGSRGDALR